MSQLNSGIRMPGYQRVSSRMSTQSSTTAPVAQNEASDKVNAASDMPTPAPAPVSASNASAAAFKDPKAALTKIELARFTGMQSPLPGKRETPFGTLYTDVKSDYIHTKRRLILYETVAYSLLGLQLFLSAMFILLGSLKLKDSSNAILALGAISTLVAGSQAFANKPELCSTLTFVIGIMAFMKGQGQPARLRQKTLGLAKVLRNLELLHQNVEWKIVTVQDIDTLEKKYQDILEEADANSPDFWAVVRTSAPEKKASGPATVMA
ncbi:hypothetical protein FKW77_008365 [Venturia effusa]|uniref:SMODS and SLOG-associating 2TM effector domain-containing protein n=1 Tax=Venturia effusa TaxID=50376 RepID=A0A517LEA8_9PEZI|nr:hypothetical protein FKW77_008365 [Venturia effusa]